MESQNPALPRASARLVRPAALSAAVFGLVLVCLLIAPAAASAGQAAVGEALFYPCTSCHPIAEDGPRKLPNGFDGHQVKLESHDKLGARACVVCHDDPAKDPGKLLLVDGTSVDITGDVSKVCYRCHSDKYNEWKVGAHGKDMPKCTSSGCHDPHSPAWIYAGPLLPFTGTGFEVRAVSDRRPFTPLASAPLAPPTETPTWFLIAIGLGAVASIGIVGTLTAGRLK